MTDLTHDRADRRRDERMDRRLVLAGSRWLAEQPPPPTAVPVEALAAAGPGRPRWLPAAVAAVAALVVGGAALAVLHAVVQGPDTRTGHPSTQATDHTSAGQQVVPFRALAAGHVNVGHLVHGHRVTPFDDVVAGGEIGGTLHPGDTLTFTAVLESVKTISLHPCPNYTIAFGAHDAVTRRLNCSQVPYYASVPRSDGTMSDFRPTLPAQTPVRFQMKMRVPDELGDQKVLWVLDGPHQMPGFYGIVHVTAR